MKKKYNEFANKFAELCEEFKDEDFDAKEVLGICDKIIDNYS